jgi:hypothetical protein
LICFTHSIDRTIILIARHPSSLSAAAAAAAVAAVADRLNSNQTIKSGRVDIGETMRAML